VIRQLKDQCTDLMGVVKLSYLVEREGWMAEKKWSTVLSLGEQQRMGMARLFFQRCDLVYLVGVFRLLNIAAESFPFGHH
jgi:ABC-type uncharacterized transport system fused permease/ATPase subunit